MLNVFLPAELLAVQIWRKPLEVALTPSPGFSVQAFAWFSELLVEHAEIFWALFGVDMDRVLAEQPPDTWDSFPLFQILNDYLRTDGEYLNEI